MCLTFPSVNFPKKIPLKNVRVFFKFKVGVILQIKISVNGVGTVDVAKLSSITTFNDESNSKDEGDKTEVQKLQKWFWEVVETFNQTERQELLYFWTGMFNFFEYHKQHFLT